MSEEEKPSKGNHTASEVENNDNGHVYTVGSYEENGSLGEQAVVQYLQTNQCSLQTAKFNDNQVQGGSHQSSGVASQWVSESVNLFDRNNK